MKLTQKINRKILPYVFSLAMAGSTIFGNYGCVDTANAKSRAKTEQVFVRSYDNPKFNGGTYSDKDVVNGTYVDNQGSKHYSEEATIRDISYDNNSVEFGISPVAFEYGKSENCTIQPALIDYSNDNKPTYNLTGSLNGSHAGFDVEDPETLYTGVLCVHDDYTERLASYPVSLGSRERIENKYDREDKQDRQDRKNKTKRNDQDKPTRNKTDNDEDNQAKPKKVKTDDKQDKNTDNKYHLETDCGDGNIYLIPGRPSDKYGQIDVEEGSSCKVYLDEAGNTIRNYDIEPEQDSAKVLHAVSNRRQIELNFKEDGTYSLIVGTDFYPNEKDILQFNVVDKEIIEEKDKVEEDKGKTEEPEKTKDHRSFLELLVSGDLLPGNDEFNAKVVYNPILGPKVDITEDINGYLSEHDDTPVLRIYHNDSLEVRVQGTDDLDYVAYLFEKEKDSPLTLDEVELKKTIGKNRYVINDDGSVTSIDGKKIVFPYKQNGSGIDKDGKLTGNEYLLILVGSDKDGEVKDLDTLVIENRADIERVFFEGLLTGTILGYTLGIVDASNPGGLFTYGQDSNGAAGFIDRVIKGTKSGGNVPQ